MGTPDPGDAAGFGDVADLGDAADLDLRRQAPLRVADGWVGFDDEALYVERDSERIRVGFDQLSELSYRDTDYFIAVLSVVLVGFGIWYVRETPRSLLFSLVGIASLYRLYHRRGEVVVRVADRPRPLTFHPEGGGAFYDALAETMGGEELSSRKSLFGR